MTTGRSYVAWYEYARRSAPALDAAYGLFGRSGESSRHGFGPLSPNTSSVEMCTMRPTFSLRAASSTTYVPTTSVWTNVPASRIERSTWVSAASGLLGEQLLGEAKRRGHDAVGTYAGDPVNGLIPLNLSDLVAAVTLVRDRRPKTVLLPAAMTGVDACESHQDQAQLVNADAPREIAKACHTLGIRLVL